MTFKSIWTVRSSSLIIFQQLLLLEVAYGVVNCLALVILVEKEWEVVSTKP